MKRTLFLALAVVVVVVLLFAAGPSLTVKQNENQGLTLELQRPAFIQPVNAQDTLETSFIGEKLDSEAGISAYFKSPTAINLTNASTACRTIESLTSDYLICSVPVANHAEHFDTHVYVNKNGWVLAYYLNTDPLSKIIDVYNKTINSTKLTSVLGTVAAAAGVAFAGETYYDFRYPDAGKMLFVAEDDVNGNDFIITLPSSYAYYYRGWASNDTGFTHFNLDGVVLTPIYAVNGLMYGTITPAQMLPGTTHTLTTTGNYGGRYAVLVIIYTVP